MGLPQLPENDPILAERAAKWRSGWSRGHYIIARTVVGLILVAFGVGVPVIQDAPEAGEATPTVEIRPEARYLIRICSAIEQYERSAPEDRQLMALQLEDVIEGAPPGIPTTPLAPVLTRAQQIAHYVRLSIGLQALTIGVGDCGEAAPPPPTLPAFTPAPTPTPVPGVTGATPSVTARSSTTLRKGQRTRLRGT
ncbi:MAG TPA: hypothetical protein VNC78_09480 [Actinomycetota bacterium]|nr:hypothetical protein [Actinomycetota bacterium]